MSASCGYQEIRVPAPVRTEPLGLLVLQPTPFCNIDCSYCYLETRSVRARMTLATVDAVLRFIRDIPARQPLPVVWHAGEPLVMPIGFYEDAIDRFRHGPHAIRCEHHIQTNATLIDDAWCEFFKRRGVRVGVSVDGPQEIHDAFRKTRAGRGTFDQAMRGIGHLRRHGIPFTVLSVITGASIARADTIWSFLTSLGASGMAFNVEEAEGSHGCSSLSGPGLQDAAIRFFGRIAELQRSTDGAGVRELDDMRRHLSAPQGSTVMRANNQPGALINIDAAGNVSTLSPELLGQTHPRYGQFAWGNVHRDSWSDVLRHPGFLQAHRDLRQGVEACEASCGYFSVCGGGNPSNKLAELGSLSGTETQHCRLHVQAVAEVLLSHIEQRRGPQGDAPGHAPGPALGAERPR